MTKDQELQQLSDLLIKFISDLKPEFPNLTDKEIALAVLAFIFMDK